MLKDLVGTRFGRLKVLREVDRNKHKQRQFECECDCGTVRPNIVMSSLTSGRTESCGCLNRERVVAATLTHGQSRRGKRSSTHAIWTGMLQRCYNKKAASYRYYGALGISVCERWHKFENFLEDMGERPEGLTLDRERGAEGYSKGNCRWATYVEQGNNTKSDVKLTVRGKTQTVAEWSRELGVSSWRVRARLRLGFTAEEALFLPVGTRRPVGSHCRNADPE